MDALRSKTVDCIQKLELILGTKLLEDISLESY
jgi:hypothetical protein